VVVTTSIIQPIQIQAVDTAMRITANFNISLQTLPQYLQVVQKNQLLLPTSVVQALMAPGIGVSHTAHRGH
jgi:hypothetical protein